MISLKTIRKFRCSLAGIVILSMVSVLSCDFLCDVGLISFQTVRPSRISKSTAHSHSDKKHTNHHHQNKAESHPSHDHGTGKHDHNATDKDGGCCDDLTRAFYSTLANAPSTLNSLGHSLELRLIKIFMLPCVLNENLLDNLTRFSPNNNHANGPPGLLHTGQYLRILLCTFLI